MKGLVGFVIIGIIIGFSGTAQSSYWIKAIGGSGLDYAPTIQVIDDGYIAIGYSDSYGAGNLDFLVVKLDKDGNPVLSKTIGGSDEEKPFCIEPTRDGGYISVGNTKSFGAGDLDFLVVKLNKDLNIEWVKTIGGREADLGFYAQQTEDGGYLVVGTTGVIPKFEKGKKNALVVKLDDKGNLLWAKTIGVEGICGIDGIQKTRDGGYVLNGITSIGAGKADAFIVKIDKDCNIVWNRAIGGSGKDTTNWDGVRQTSDGGYIFAGETESFGSGDKDGWVVKLNQEGNLEWCRVIGGKDDDALWSVNETSDGGFIVAGVANRAFGVRQEQEKRHGEFIPGRRGTEGQPFMGPRMKERPPRQMAQGPFNQQKRREKPQQRPQPLESKTDSIDILYAKLDKNGNIIWAKTIGGIKPGLEEVEEVEEIKDGYILAGVTNAIGAGKGDFFIAKVNKDGSIEGCDYIKTFSGDVTSAIPNCISIQLEITPVSPEVSSVSPTVTTPNLKVETVYSK